MGRDFDPVFTPELTPKQLLALGVFGGKYMTDCAREFPKSWYSKAKLSPEGRNPKLNYFGVDASQPLAVWKKKGPIHARIHVAGSNGIAAIIWAGARRMTPVKSNVGRRSAAILRR